MNPSIKEFLKLASAIVGAFLVKNGYTTQEESSSLLEGLGMIVGGIVLAAPAAKSAWSRRKDAGKQVPAFVIMVLAVVSLMALPGCTSVTPANPDGTTSTEKQLDWATINYVAKSGTKIATVAALNEKPEYKEEVAAINVAVAAVFTGTPTVETVTAALSVAAPKMDAGDVKLIAVAIVDAYGYYVVKTGNTVILDSSEEVKGLVKALTDGIAEGLAIVG